MEKLTAKKKLAVVKLYFSGYSYGEIKIKTGVSQGAISNIIAELKSGGFPEFADLADQIELLRELALDLKHSGQAPGQCAVGNAVLMRIHECGLDIADIERWPEILKLAGGDDKAKEFVASVYRIQDFMNETELSLDEIDAKIQYLETKAAQLQPTLDMVDENKQEIAELHKKQDNLTKVNDLLDEKYSLLDPIVSKLQKRQADLEKQINEEESITGSTQAALAIWSKENKKLVKAGFTLNTLVAFNDKLRAIAARHHITMQALRERLLKELKFLDKGLTLEAMLKEKHTELQMEKKALTSARNERKQLEAGNAVLRGENAGLESSIKVTRDAVIKEILKIIPTANAMLSEFNGELRHGSDEILGVIQHLKDEAMETGQEIGRYQGIVEVNEWLIDILALIKGDEGLEAMKVRAILLRLLRGAQPWMKHNAMKTGVHQNPLKTIELLIMEIEGWQV